MYAGTDVHRDRIIKNDYALLQSLASAASPNRHLGSEISAEKAKLLDQQREAKLKYGRVLPQAISGVP